MRMFGAVVALCFTLASPQERPVDQGFSFRSNVNLTNVTVTVTNDSGHFVTGLKRNDFEIYEDGVLQSTSHFDAERVPVSLGITVDTSGSMVGERWVAAQAALSRFLVDLLGEQDEVFLQRFDSRPELVQLWTSDRRAAGRMLAGVTPRGGTAMYDAVADAIPLAQQGTKRKKALVIISDGQDTSSQTRPAELTRLIQESEVLVYAIGIDTSGNQRSAQRASQPAPRQVTTAVTTQTKRPPVPSPFPGRKPATVKPPTPPASAPPAGRTAVPSTSGSGTRGSNSGVNADALRSMTDDSGGRTEIIYSAQDLEAATAGIAGELSQQYFLAYTSVAPKDGRWHTIEVRIKKKGDYLVRARRGFIAS
ncbi:MAG: VWA domain-containing protein [Acidobacteria bacterium]|nr:VWA domain-containing protein [Acidobacteriota bacterium]